MLTRLTLFCCLVLINSLCAEETECNFEPLFNGKDLAGWEGAGEDAAKCWVIEEGELVCTGKPGPWLRSKEEFGDFELRLEYRLKEAGNSGVYIRVPSDGNHHGNDSGIEVQMLDDNAPKYKELKAYQYSGSLYAIVPAEPRVAKPAGEWNQLSIRCLGHHYEVHHNGQRVVKASPESSPELTRRRTSGFLGLQNHNEEVRIRNIRVQRLKKSEDVNE